MHTETQIAENLYYIGASDRRISLFENAHPLNNGISYNSYLFLDEKTAVLDTVDEACANLYFANLDFLLKDRPLDYLIVTHMEPDHAALIGNLLLRHPETTIVVNAMSKRFLLNYFPNLASANLLLVKEGSTLSIGKHCFQFIMAPMVHWPEVMFAYESTKKILFSADAFGTFGALSGNVFADERSLDAAHLPELRRYYANIVGKFGDQVNAVLKKVAPLELKMIAPLHGPIYTKDLAKVIDVYKTWASYEPEEKDGVMIAYSSCYGNTAEASACLATKLAQKGVSNLAMYDVSNTDPSYLIAESFRVKTIVLATTTYNAGVFVKMEDFLHDFANHKIRNRNLVLIENGSWAPAAKAGMKKILEGLDLNYLDESLTITSTLKEEQIAKVEEIADIVVASLG